MNEMIMMLTDNVFVLVVMWVMFLALTVWNSGMAIFLTAYFSSDDREQLVRKYTGIGINKLIDVMGFEAFSKAMFRGSAKVRIAIPPVIWFILGVILFA